MQVERYKLDNVLVKGTVERITPVIDCLEEMEAGDDNRIKGDKKGDEGLTHDGLKKTVKYFQVKLQEGVAIKARAVVMATGPTRAQMANIPSWVGSIGESYPEERLQHTVHLMHHLAAARQKDTEGESDFSEMSRTPVPQHVLKACYMIHKIKILSVNLSMLL